MSKAEERAFEMYPEEWTWGFGGRESFKYDKHAFSREACRRGYEQAEKDLAPLIEAATIAYEAWNGGTMDDVRKAMAELGKRIKEAKK